MDRRAAWWGMTQLQGWGPLKAHRAYLEVGKCVESLLHRHGHRLPFPLGELEQRWHAVDEQTRLAGGRALTWDDADYPRGLAQLADPPPVVYVKGQTPFPSHPTVAVVGTRRCTDDAARWAYQAGAHIATCGGTVVSGLALGIDIAAMRGALDAGGRVVACLGHGLERIHPKGHQRWAEAMLERGAWITEYPIHTRVDRWHFAHRNRIVAGMAEATLLVQSPANGGGMITARLAVESHRDLLVLEPYDHRPAWQGNRDWLEQGATAVRRVEEVMHGPLPAQPLVARRSPPPGLVAVWEALQGSGGCSVEALSEATNLPETRVRRQLLALELGGWVRRSPGGWFFAESDVVFR